LLTGGRRRPQASRDGLPIRELRADRDKISRALTAAARLEAGHVCWPKDAPWLSDWEAELLAFPNGWHDDQADCFAYAALDTTSTPNIDPVALGGALNAADAELFQPGPWPH
jgi:phage terminase large subunit-like protein